MSVAGGGDSAAADGDFAAGADKAAADARSVFAAACGNNAASDLDISAGGVDKVAFITTAADARAE